MQSVISVQALNKIYQDVTAVDNISFEIEEVHCFGLLGPNGAGKTTTIEIMEGICECNFLPVYITPGFYLRSFANFCL